MRFITKNIANFLTCTNLFLGCIGILLVLEDEYLLAFYAMLGSALADFLDGFAARLFKADDGIGKDLDSLADVVTFGVLPGFFLVQYIRAAGFEWALPFGPEYTALLVPVFSALRLARFNNDTRQRTGFLGLPTPANALIISSFVLWALPAGESRWPMPATFHDVWVITGFILLMCFLLVSEIPLIALKFKGFDLKKDWLKVLLVILIPVMAILLNFGAALPSLILYIVISFFNHRIYEIQSRN